MIALRENPLSLLFEFQKNPYYFFDQIKPRDSRQIKKVYLGPRRFYFCYHPDHAKHILQENKTNYPKSSLVLKKILPLSGPSGLIQLNDNEALPVRKASGRLMCPNNAIRLGKFVESFVKEIFADLDRSAAINEAVDLKPFLTQLILRTAGVFILDEDIQSKAEKLNQAFVELNRMAGESLRSIVSFPYSPKRNRYLKVIHGEFDRIIEDLLTDDRISLLHELSKKNFSRSFLRDQVKAFMFAGYDTTASSLIFAVDSIARNNKAQERIYKEHLKSYREAIYTQAAYKESLRLYPSAYFLPRQVTNNDLISGQKIKANSQVFISIRHIHRNEEIYEKPMEFYPERFLKEQPHTHSFIPFGGGPRICIGAPLALMEATIVLQKLCERYKISPQNQSPPEIEGLITAHTKSPLSVRLERRS